MKKIMRFMIVLCIALTVAMPSVNIHAATNEEAIAAFVRDNGPISNPDGKEVRAASDKWNTVSGYFSETDTGGMTAVNAMSDGYTKTYYYNAANAAEIVNTANLNSSIEETNTKIDEMTGNLNIVADTKGGAELVGGLVPIVNVAVGVVVIAIVLFLGLYTAFDVMYLAFPVFRTFSESKLQEGKSGVMTKKTSSGETTYRFISDDAVRAYQQSIVDGGNKQPYIKYLWSRAWAYISLAMITVILLTGNYSVLLKIGMNIGEGLINIVQSI